MAETGLSIRLFGDPSLRKKADSVKEITSEHLQVLSQMAQLMYDKSGVGLAAPQVGINQAMLVADAGSGLYKLINPQIVRKKGSQRSEEGCLSIPGVCLKIKRAKKIILQAQDEEARPVEIEAEGLLASVFQHELDHLKGRLIVDYASLFEKIRIKRILDENLSPSERKSCRLQL
ncbi:MAG: peptide deformylase [Candidatus Omnitrophica bacterium]|nr:peptide deformylase [Candidatus Omnitrophota bacterium]